MTVFRLQNLVGIAAAIGALVLVDGCTKEARRNRSVERADRFYASEKFDEAEIEYRHTLQIASFDSTAIRQLGYIYWTEGRLPLAYVYLKKASEQAPNDNAVRLRLGQCELPIGLAKDARDNALRLLQAKPVSDEALLLLAAASRTPGEMDEARKLLDSLRGQDSDRSGYHLALGLLAAKNRDLKIAEEELSKAVALDPKSAANFEELGDVFWQGRRLDQAEKALKTAYDLAPQRSAIRLHYIQFKLETGAVAEAKTMLGNLTAKVPDYIPALVLMMKVAFQERRYDDCAAVVQKILIRDSNNYEAILQRSGLKLIKGDTAAAIDELEHLNAVYGRIAQLKYRLGVAYLQNGDATKAENALYQAIEIAPDDDQAQVLLAELELRKGDSGAAIERLNQILKARPQSERAYLLLARAYMSQKNVQQSLAVYRHLQELAPKDPQIPFLIGMVELYEKHPVDARMAFEQSISIAPDWARSLEMLVNMDLAANQFQAASKRVVGLISQFPKSAAPWVLMEKIHLAEHDLDAAESDLLKAIDVDPKYQSSYLLLARLYVATNKHRQALEKLNAIAEKTKSPNALFQIGLIREELKEYDSAREAYERLLAVDPRSVPALDRLARIYSENLGKPDKALELARKALELQPDDPRALDTLGWVLYKRGEYHTALANLASAAEREPSEPEFRYHLGMAHYMLGEEGPARLAFQQAITAGPDSPSKEDARKRLDVLDLDLSKVDSAAEKNLEGMVRVDPKDPVARVRLAAVQARRGGAAEAAKGFEAALKINPRDVKVMVELIRLYSGALHNPDRARELAQTAHEVAPNDAQISRTLGQLLYDNGDYVRSLDLLQQASKDIHDDAGFAFDLARTYYCVGKVAQAENVIRDATSGADLSSPELQKLRRLITASESASNAQSEVQEAEEVLRSKPADIPASMVVALSQETQNPTEARRIYEGILAQDASFAPAIRQLTLLYAQRVEDEPKALELATKAREAFPDDPDMNKVLGVLDYRKGDYAGATRLLQQSMRKRDTDGEAFFYLGMAHFHLKELTASRLELQRAIGMNLAEAQIDEAKQTLDEMSQSSKSRSLSDVPIH